MFSNLLKLKKHYQQERNSMAYEGTKLTNFTPPTEPVKELEIIDVEIGPGSGML
jgi:hypothetical protein